MLNKDTEYKITQKQHHFYMLTVNYLHIKSEIILFVVTSRIKRNN